jgi:hypothetical protein
LTSFLALYRGESIGAAKIVAVNANPELVADFAGRMLKEPVEAEIVRDPVLSKHSCAEGGRLRWRVGPQLIQGLSVNRRPGNPS